MKSTSAAITEEYTCEMPPALIRESHNASISAMSNSLYYSKQGIVWGKVLQQSLRSDVEIKSLAQAVLKLCLSEGINK